MIYGFEHLHIGYDFSILDQYAIMEKKAMNPIVEMFCGEGYGGEATIKCPYCNDDYSHIREVFTRKGNDEYEAGIYDGTVEKGKCDYRRSALVIVFDGECSHSWELVIQQHKGINILQVNNVTSDEIISCEEC